MYDFTTGCYCCTACQNMHVCISLNIIHILCHLLYINDSMIDAIHVSLMYSRCEPAGSHFVEYNATKLQLEFVS